MVLVDNNGNKWVTRGGYEVDDLDNITCFWCIPLEDCSYFDVECGSYTKLYPEDIVSTESEF